MCVCIVEFKFWFLCVLIISRHRSLGSMSNRYQDAVVSIQELREADIDIHRGIPKVSAKVHTQRLRNMIEINEPRMDGRLMRRSQNEYQATTSIQVKAQKLLLSDPRTWHVDDPAFKALYGEHPAEQNFVLLLLHAFMSHAMVVLPSLCLPRASLHLLLC